MWKFCVNFFFNFIKFWYFLRKLVSKDFFVIPITIEGVKKILAVNVENI